MPHPILVTGAAGGQQGSTGRVIAMLLLEHDISVRAFVHTIDARCDELRAHGAEIVEGDLLNPSSVQAAMIGVKRAYFTYPVADGLLEAATLFATAARDAHVELIVNNSQFQSTPDDPFFRDLQHAASFRNLQHRLADRIFDWAQVHAVHLQTPPYYENVRALVGSSVAAQDTVFLPWGDGDAVIPLTGAEDVARVAVALLTASALPSQNVYPLVSETPTVRQIVETIARSIGRPIRYVPITDEQWADAVKERINPHALDHLAQLWKYFRLNKEPRHSTHAIREVTGRDPQTLEQFFRDHAKSMGGAAQ